MACHCTAAVNVVDRDKLGHFTSTSGNEAQLPVDVFRSAQDQWKWRSYLRL